jgi:hypothetical protein
MSDAVLAGATPAAAGASAGATASAGTDALAGEPAPVITAAWAIYFLLLAMIAEGRANAHIRTTCVFALIGLIGYRLDGAWQGKWADDGSAMRRRSLVIMGVLIAALVYYRMLGGG